MSFAGDGFTSFLGLAFCFSVLLSATSSVVATDCYYGTLPGYYNESEVPGKRWQLLTPNCQLENLLEIYADQVHPSNPPPPIGIMYLTDSMDRFLMHAYCYGYNGQLSTGGTIAFNWCRKNGTSPLTLGQVYVTSVTPQTPVHIPGYPLLKGYKQRIAESRNEWDKVFPGQEPQMLVLGGGVWDIQRWIVSDPQWLLPIEKNVKETMEVSEELVKWWIQCVQEYAEYSASLFPNSRLIWRTFAMPQINETGLAAHPNLANKAILAQIRAAGVAAAINMGIEVIDLEQLVAGFHSPSQYLMDRHHAKPEVYLEVLNVMLNVYLRGPNAVSAPKAAPEPSTATNTSDSTATNTSDSSARKRLKA